MKSALLILESIYLIFIENVWDRQRRVQAYTRTGFNANMPKDECPKAERIKFVSYSVHFITEIVLVTFMILPGSIEPNQLDQKVEFAVFESIL